MGVQFFESMSGELVDASGKARHVAIDLRCDATRTTSFLANGRARVSGTIRALPWTAGAALTGTVDVRPLTGSRIEYHLEFTGSDGAQLRLHGRKDIRLRRPVTTMTVMRTSLDRDGARVADGTLQFFLNDLPSFLRSWQPHSAVRRARAVDDCAGAADAVLTGGERDTLSAFAAATITADQIVPAADERTVAATVEILRHTPPMALRGYRAGLRSLNALARAHHGKRFARLNPRQRRALLDRLNHSRGMAGESLVQAIGLPVKMAHFSRHDYLVAVGLLDSIHPNASAAKPVVEPEPRWMSGVAVPEHMEHATRIECDVIVVGTGAGGGAVAATLAEKGLAVVMVEEGRYIPRSEFVGGPEERMLTYWRDGGMNLAVGNSPMSVPTARMVGGTTAINAGTCFRTPPAVLGEWRAAGFPQDFAPELFEVWLDRAERELQVTPADPRYLGRIANVVAKGAGEMGGHHGPLDRNAPGCDGQGMCFVGCPTDARRSANVSWIPRALRAGAQLFTGLPVTRILMNGRRAIGVLAEGQDRFGAPRRLEVHARAVVLAAGSLLTPLLLRSNGVSLPWIGRNLSIHPALGALALFDEAAGKPWRAIPQGYGVEGLGDERIRFEGGYMPPQLAAGTMPFDGPELSRWMASWPRVEQFGFMTRDTGVGTVRSGAGGRPLISYSVTPRVLESFQKGSAALAEMLIRGGASEVATRITGVGTVRNVYEARDILKRRLAPRHFRAMGFHPLGTARMGTGPATAVVDFENRVFGYQDLYVADGACVPTSLGVNPQLTIMAMALRAADIVAADLSGG